jgi:hypothetical protein
VPTTRPRHTITETDDIRAMLDDAARRWPERAGRERELLLELLRSGHAETRAVLANYEREVERQQALVDDFEGLVDVDLLLGGAAWQRR